MGWQADKKHFFPGLVKPMLKAFWLGPGMTRLNSLGHFVIYFLKKNILMNDVLWLELGYVGASNTYSIKNHVKPNSFWSPCIRTHHRTLLLKRVRFWGGTALWTWLCGREPHKSFFLRTAAWTNYIPYGIHLGLYQYTNIYKELITHH